MHSNDLIALVVVVFAVLFVKLLKGPLGHAIADRLRGAAPPDPGVLDELEAVKTRLAEVEERLDFAERMLAQGEQAERLPGRGEP
jgi:hypothetical protein